MIQTVVIYRIGVKQKEGLPASRTVQNKGELFNVTAFYGDHKLVKGFDNIHDTFLSNSQNDVKKDLNGRGYFYIDEEVKPDE